MEELAIRVEHVSKEYRLGAIGGATLKGEIQSKLAKIFHKEDPNLKIGEKAHEKNERFLALNDMSFDVKKGETVGIIGTNGSGKSTQFRLLSEHLEKDNVEFKHIVFPRYDQESSALIRMYLGGAFGDKPSDVNAYAASAFYAVDRFASYRQDWGKWYEDGGFVRSHVVLLFRLRNFARIFGHPIIANLSSRKMRT